MTRTAIRHTLSTLAAVAVVTALASSPVSAQGGNGRDDGWAIGMRAVSQQKAVKKRGRPIIVDHSGLVTQGIVGVTQHPEGARHEDLEARVEPARRHT